MNIHIPEMCRRLLSIRALLAIAALMTPALAVAHEEGSGTQLYHALLDGCTSDLTAGTLPVHYETVAGTTTFVLAPPQARNQPVPTRCSEFTWGRLYTQGPGVDVRVGGMLRDLSKSLDPGWDCSHSSVAWALYSNAPTAGWTKVGGGYLSGRWENPTCVYAIVFAGSNWGSDTATAAEPGEYRLALFPWSHSSPQAGHVFDFCPADGPVQPVRDLNASCHMPVRFNIARGVLADFPRNVIPDDPASSFRAGTAGNDLVVGTDPSDFYLMGAQGDDVIKAGPGTGMMFGGAGNDIYHWGRSANGARIYERDWSATAETTDFDRLIFDDVTQPASLSWFKDDGDLTITDTVSNTFVRVTGWFADPRYRVGRMELANGTILNVEHEVNQLTCHDGIQDEAETGVDCGGACGACPTVPDATYPQTGVSACTGAKNCTNAGAYVDLNADTGYAWTVAGGNGGRANLYFKVSSATGTRSMSLWRNGVNTGLIVSATDATAPRPAGAEVGPFAVTLVSGNNVIELRDTQGTNELDVYAVRVDGL